MFEELEITGEDLLKTKHPKIYIGKLAVYPDEKVSEIVDGFRAAVAVADDDAIRELFSKYLPESTITQKIKEATQQ
jgi:FlaA1/EpsC-like NDP-sugar epimerase